ncbi:SWIB/MDM2 domain-containing protein [Sphaerosporella brunnea]|uniref:SWIB/MDM2 domain-containing protein n=1 Tax=Sphaerosporella brunnea TaxID=1250544 RepID=A0A5J5F0D7_9PEZI|nr:SWIB/MDM2 domain-containing protein [Sphaerosporella brunnea]
MSTLSEDDRAQYTPIIDAILRVSDLSTISVKKVRTGLSERTGVDFVPLKKSIDTLITDRFDILLAERDNPPVKSEETPDLPTTSTTSTATVTVASSPDAASPKKRKSPSSVEEDARLAAELHAQLNGGRATRKKAPATTKAKRTTKKLKSRDTVESDVSGDEDANGKPIKKKRKANPNNAFMKPLILSEPLAAFIGESQMSRPEVVKKIWAYVKSKDLQDPNDRRYIICDESLKPVFGDKVHMFTMNKVLATNMYKAEEVATPTPGPTTPTPTPKEEEDGDSS